MVEEDEVPVLPPKETPPPTVKNYIQRFWEKHFVPTREFADETTIHGVKYALGTSWPLAMRIFWGVLVATCFSFCVWQCVQTIVGSSIQTGYISFERKTTVSYTSPLDKFPMPALTFCNDNRYLRSKIGGLEPLYRPLLNQYGIYDDLTVQEMCNATNGTSKYTYPQLMNMTIADMHKEVDHTSNNTVLECNLLGLPLDCSRLFLNHLTDTGWCFTFNPSASLINQFSTVENPMGRRPIAYGMTAADRLPLYFNNSGYNNGIQFVMNVSEYEYCTSGPQHSVGMLVLIHDAETDPLHLPERLIDIAPGFASNVAISLQDNDRNSDVEAANYCTTYNPLEYYPYLTEYKYKNLCYSNCYFKQIVKTCGCYPAYAPPIAHTMGPICTLALDQLCVANFEQSYIENGSLSYCKPCPDPCQERTFDSDITFSIYPSEYAFPLLLQQYNPPNRTLEFFRDNYLSVNFFLLTLENEVIIETISLSWMDLLNALGGAIGLCLGGSIISAVELCFWVIYQTRYFLRLAIQHSGEPPPPVPIKH